MCLFYAAIASSCLSLTHFFPRLAVPTRGACGAWARSLRLLGLTLGLQANAVTYGAAVDRVTSDRWPQAVQLLHVGLLKPNQMRLETPGG